MMFAMQWCYVLRQGKLWIDSSSRCGVNGLTDMGQQDVSVSGTDTVLRDKPRLGLKHIVVWKHAV